VYATIKKSDTQEIRVSVDNFKEHDFFSVREFYKDEESDKFLPTKKGITGGISDSTILDELIAGLQKIRETLF
jgi:hypothetical protein